jgi:hypothetical protein
MALKSCFDKAIDRIVDDCFKRPTDWSRRLCIREALADLLDCLHREHGRELRVAQRARKARRTRRR